MTQRNSLLEEIIVKGLKSPITQQMLFDLSIGLLPLLLILLARG